MAIIQGILVILFSAWMVLDQQGLVLTTWFPIMAALFVGLIMGDMKTAMVIGGTLVWVLYPTIIGSISAYMGLQGNPTGAIIWLLLNIFFLFFRFKLFDIGYDSGLKLVTALGDKLSVFTEAASIMGLTVVGALIPSVVKMQVALVFQTGKVKMPIQTQILDQIMPALLPVLLTFGIYKLISGKKLTVIQIIFGLIIVSLICSYFGILKVPA